MARRTRRFWSQDEGRRIVEQTCAPGVFGQSIVAVDGGTWRRLEVVVPDYQVSISGRNSTLNDHAERS